MGKITLMFINVRSAAQLLTMKFHRHSHETLMIIHLVVLPHVLFSYCEYIAQITLH